MKALIAIVMFLFGLFVGVLVVPTFQEFSSSMYSEEEYSTPRIKTLLNDFGIILPPGTADINLFMTQDGEKKQVWMKCECSPEVKDEFVDGLNVKHSGLFNRVVASPKMMDGTPVAWWTFRNTFRYYEFHDMCVAYDELLRNLYLYAIMDGAGSAPAEPSGK